MIIHCFGLVDRYGRTGSLEKLPTSKGEGVIEAMMTTNSALCTQQNVYIMSNLILLLTPSSSASQSSNKSSTQTFTTTLNLPAFNSDISSSTPQQKCNSKSSPSLPSPPWQLLFPLRTSRSAPTARMPPTSAPRPRL